MSIVSNFFSCQERTKNKTVNPQYRPKVISHELFFDHSRLKKSQEQP